MNVSFLIRSTTPGDAPAFHAVMMAAGMDPRSSWTRTTVAQVEWSLVNHGGFVAISGERVVGCVGHRPDGPATLTLNKLAVLPEARGSGVARALVAAVEEVARERHFERVLLAVSQFNLSVIGFYEKLGYAVNGAATYAFASPLSPPPVVMTKQIDAR
ncbi:GNAT family N-acetyltransferase [Deinococcus yavapaiensis]|uniref:Ribosomal protein S18 acetylase RimI-like enzyme n=1 Tax=Deinococcus yavapaiensis KR-236 TaxID=694435 RepID=A0A318SIS0_9DEIO|nr:GNAT family N-acetyltransferase [Deinococcus yavapaiensis]PYE51813.1 ribosomal protein S18 acetylase RimI-like enzyme [Deinococcus yavapaiensis KR-236]